MGYAGRDPSLELRLSDDRNELAIIDLIGRRRACEARLSARRRVELAEALERMSEAAGRSEYSYSAAKVTADDGGRVDVAALPSAVAIYVFRPGTWRSRSVHLAPADASRLASDIQRDAGSGVASAD